MIRKTISILVLVVLLVQTGIAQHTKKKAKAKTRAVTTRVAVDPVKALSPNVRVAIETVKPEQIKADITYLADDRLSGRMPGTPGYKMAADYVINHLEALDVKPAGENGTWLQTVRLRRAFTQEADLTIAYDQSGVPGTRNANEYAVYPNPADSDVHMSAPLVFAGFGISEPKLGYDDYAGVDVKGKIVVIFRGSPDKFSSSVAAHAANTSTILKTAAEHGALGVLIGSADSTLRRLPDFSKGIYSVIDAEGKVVVSRTFYSDQLKVFASAKFTMMNFFFQYSHKSVQGTADLLKQGKPQSFPINMALNVQYTSKYQDIISYNVIGKIPGSDPVLKNQYVVHSAHLDHLGIGAPIQGDSIYNGAHDNASGVACLLGIASIYKNIKIKPKRSILIVMVTGEEMGDLGSGYFAKHPTVPGFAMIADVNTDMPTIIAPLLSITALGAEHSSLETQVKQAAGYFNLGVEPDPEPKQARFTRSDQYSFVLAGVPALHIKYGNKTADGKNNLDEIVAPWRAKYYHKPQDDINGIFDFEAGKKYTQLNFLIGYLVAQNPQRPVWNFGDIFAGK